MVTRTIAFVLLAFFIATVAASAQSSQALYQQGLGRAQLGDYEGAIKIFDRIVRQFPNDHLLVGRAKLQMVDSWLKLGDAKALDLLNDVIKNYKDQPELIAEAKRLSERSGRVSRLTDKDVLVLADFSNTTGDPVFNLALREALAGQIEQSPFLKIMDAVQVQQTMKSLRRSPDEPLTSAVAHDVCVKAREKATLEGSIGKVGDTYLIALNAINCQTGMTLAREQATTRDKNGVLQALFGAATGMRIRLGESLSSIKSPWQYGRNVTTSSLEAFEQYALAGREFYKGSMVTASSHYRRATELDPNFAMAFAVGGAAYGNSGDFAHRKEFLDRAYALLDQVSSERERLFITAQHYAITGELNKQIETYELLTRSYPRDTWFHNNLGNLYNTVRQTDKAIAEYQASIREQPLNFVPYVNLANLYLPLERIEDAKAVVDKGIALGVDVPQLYRILQRTANLLNDRAAAEKALWWFAGKPEESGALLSEATQLLTLGQPRRARALVERAGAMSLRNISRTTPIPVDGAIAIPVPPLEAQIKAFESGAFPPSIPAPSPAVRAEMPAGMLNQPRILYALGQALLSKQQGLEAAAEFQKILDRRVTNWGPFYPFAYLGVARGAALAGDTAGARKAYEDLLALWKDAEPELPALIDAKKEYAALLAGQPIELPPSLQQPQRQPDSVRAGAATTDDRIAGRWETEAFPGVVLVLDVNGSTLTGILRRNLQNTRSFSIYQINGRVDGGTITFTVPAPGVIVTFTGTPTIDGIVFTRDVQVRAGGSPGLPGFLGVDEGPGILGVDGPRTFTAKRSNDSSASPLR